MVFSGMPGNPLTREGLQQRLNNAASRGISSAGALAKYFHGMPGNPLTREGLQQRLNNTSSSGRDLSTLGGIIDPKPASPVASRAAAAELQSPASFDYIDAPWASAYGLSKETAYLEAMENTGYQRSVADMQRAGLNPAVIFGSGGGYSAGAPAFVASGSGSGGGSGRRFSGRKSSGKLFSGSAYSVMSALGGIVGAAATKSAGGYWLGTSLAQGAMSALSLLTGHKG